MKGIPHQVPTFHADTLYAETTVLELIPSKTKADRGVVYGETCGVNQIGTLVLTLRRRVSISATSGVTGGGAERL
jgi:acyl dehydratase